jgi:hypothetical protein
MQKKAIRTTEAVQIAFVGEALCFDSASTQTNEPFYAGSACSAAFSVGLGRITASSFAKSGL